jgi:NAD(P)-dependent dehydrogenase (short-subunit alcohol dehydrogenase family)
VHSINYEGFSNMTLLSNKVAIITGASSGIGYATAKLFSKEGARVVVGARRQPELDSLVEEITQAGGHAVALVGDVKDEAYAKALVELAVGRFGGLDVAFNNAGTMGEMGPTPDVSLAGWEDTISTNLTSAFLGAKYQLPAMLSRNGGSMIFTSSFVGYTVGFPGSAAYAASKAGLIGLTQALASEFGAMGIRVNALLPGGTDTPMGRTFANTPETLAFVQGLHALKRLATPDEIAQSALYLASDASSFSTGSALLADGGVSISRT